MNFICKLKEHVEEQFVNQSMVSPCKYQSINNDILEGRLAKQRCGEYQQGVEPTVGHKHIEHKVRVRSRTETLSSFLLCSRITKNKCTNLIIFSSAICHYLLLIPSIQNYSLSSVLGPRRSA